jgi:creatinine amidohydrolase/Fe(II)-dependent formamide hydrolase-like protein
MLLDAPHPAWLPSRVNDGPWVAHYTADELERRLDGPPVVLPIGSCETEPAAFESLGSQLLPPLFREGLDAPLQGALIREIERTFPYYPGSKRRARCKSTIQVVEMPRAAQRPPAGKTRVLAFSVDTAVEQHGPQLPLATDRIQSYAALRYLARQVDGVRLAPPLDYGHLTWGLARGLSVDITADLTTRYVARYAAALNSRYQPEAMYVVDVHGSPVHRRAIETGLQASGVRRWKFRWVHEPLVEFAFARGDQHAGSVETAVVEAIDRQLLDAAWWPGRIGDLAAGQISFEQAIALQGDLPRFVEFAESSGWNGIVGHIENYPQLDGPRMLARLGELACRDVAELLA